MGELTKYTDEDDTSEEDNKRPKNSRWVRPPLVPTPLEIRQANERAARPLPPLEQVLGKKPEEDDEDDEDEEDGEDGEAKKGVAGKSEAAEGAALEAKSAAAGNTTAAEISQTPEAAAKSAQEADDDIFYVSHEPQHIPEFEPAAYREAEEDSGSDTSAGPSAASAGGGAAPPPIPPGESSFFGKSEEPWPGSGPARGAAASPDSPFGTPFYNAAPPASAERPGVEMSDLKQSAEEERRRNLRRLIVAGVVTGIVVKAYIDSKTKAITELLDPLKQVGDLVADQLRTSIKGEKTHQQTENLATRVTNVEHAMPTVAAEAAAQVQANQEQLFDAQGNEIVLQPGWHVERASGGYSVVLDEHNRVVHDAIRYGEAFQRDQRREQLSDDLFAAVDNAVLTDAAHAAAQAAQHSSAAAPVPSVPAPSVSPEPQPVDIGHRLSSGLSPLASALTSPWLWTAIALLIIIYFVAALA